VNGLTVQIGPRGTARLCAALGRVIWRDKLVIALAVVLAVQVLGIALLVRNHLAAVHAAPVSVPTAFCPAGQRMTGTADGWPVCIGDRP
jgi:hypothetical protein